MKLNKISWNKETLIKAEEIHLELLKRLRIVAENNNEINKNGSLSEKYEQLRKEYCMLSFESILQGFKDEDKYNELVEKYNVLVNKLNAINEISKETQ